MNYGELTEYIERFILKGVDVDPDLIPLAINQALVDLQRGILIEGAVQQHDWTGMEAHMILPYTDGGIGLPGAITRVRAVYHLHTESTGQQVRGKYIMPTSQEARDNRRGGHERYHHDYDVARQDNCESWWVEERRLKLGSGRREWHGAECLTKTYWIDVYRLVNPLVNPTDENWFTCQMWDAVAYLAAAVGFESEFDPKRIALYLQRATVKIQAAINADQRFEDAGVSDDVVPARPRLFGGNDERRLSY